MISQNKNAYKNDASMENLAMHDNQRFDKFDF